MASVKTSIARGSSSLLNTLSGSGLIRSKHTTSFVGCRSLHNSCRRSQLLNMAIPATNGPQLLTKSIAGSTLICGGMPRVDSSQLAPTGYMMRFFGGKGSRMGHHIQNLDEMAHNESREEASKRREEKKTKSKKARLASHKAGEPGEAAAVENDSEDGGADDDVGPGVDEFGNALLPEPDAIRSKMLAVVASLDRSFSSIRGGEATPELFDAVRVSAYGEMVPISSVGQVVIEDQRRATISCFDPAVASDVRDAVRDMQGMNLAPYVEEGGSGVVVVPMPRVSEETRREIVKELGRQAENGRQRVRRIRRGAMDVVKKGKDGKMEGTSKDDAFRVGKDIESVTEEILLRLNDIVAKKQKSVMED